MSDQKESASNVSPEFELACKSLDLTESNDLKEARWASIEAVADDFATTNIEALIRLAYGSRQLPLQSSLDNIRARFTETDPDFKQSGNSRELQILSAVCLAQMMRGDCAGAAETITSVLTTSFGGARKPDLPINITSIANKICKNLAVSRRDRPDLLSFKKAPNIKLDFEKSAEKIKQGIDAANIASAFTMAGIETKKAINAYHQRQSDALEEINSFIEVQDEELQILWWLLNRQSIDLDCTFDSISSHYKSFVLAKEMASMTALLPEPSSLDVLLVRAGIKAKGKVDITSVIDEIDNAWLNTFLPETEVSPVSTPVHFALKRLIETGSGRAWVKSWCAAVGVPESYSMQSLDFYRQFYREQALLRFVD